ncbi:MAG: hypothetical protein Q4D37_10110 [Oscillospiraceae bacterium]|nr:hypothetical protein [Oscillospiraceae bacterium]
MKKGFKVTAAVIAAASSTIGIFALCNLCYSKGYSDAKKLFGDNFQDWGNDKEDCMNNHE